MTASYLADSLLVHPAAAGNNPGMGPCGSDPTVREWLRDQRRRNLSPGTIEKRESAVRRLVEHAGKPMLQINREDIERWLDARPGIASKTRYTEISHIAAFFKWAIREEHLEVDPTMRITRPKVKQGLPRPIATDDLRRAIAQAPTAELAAMLYLAAYGGLRCAEISQMEAGDLLETHDPPVMIVHGKGSKDRIVPIHPELPEHLRRHGLPLRGRVFPGCPPWRVSHMIRGHLIACGIQASAHQLRHWFATECYGLCGDLRLTQELLGHASPATTAIYTKWSQAKAMSVVSQLAA